MGEGKIGTDEAPECFFLFFFLKIKCNFRGKRSPSDVPGDCYLSIGFVLVVTINIHLRALSFYYMFNCQITTNTEAMKNSR